VAEGEKGTLGEHLADLLAVRQNARKVFSVILDYIV
jgi:hypothetical protein